MAKRITAEVEYSLFCDANGLQRIDATAEQHLENLDKMLVAVANTRNRYVAEINNRCECCGGTGKKAA